MLRQIKLPMCKAAFIGKLEQEALLDLARHFINAVIAKTRFCYIDRCIIICCPYKKVKRTAFDKKETCYEPDHRLLFPPRQYGNIALQAKNDLNCEAIKIVPEEAYGNYISAYVLTLVCIRIAKSAGHTKQNVDMVMDKVPVLRRYFHDISFNMHVSLYRSLGLNVFYAIMKLGFSIYYRSVWFGTLSGYYFFLAVMRFVLLRYSGKSEFGKNLSAEWRRYRKYRSPVMSAAKVLHLVAALVMSAKDDLPSKQRGFLLGIDDYMVKPVQLDELLLRVRALLRRANIEMERKLTVGNLELDADGMTAAVDGEEVPVTTREFNILYKLLSYPKKTFSRVQLMDEFWGVDSDTSLRAVDVYITKLRDKFSGCGGFEIKTVRGLGYKAVLK